MEAIKSVPIQENAICIGGNFVPVASVDQELYHECGPVPGIDSLPSKIFKFESQCSKVLINARFNQENGKKQESDDLKKKSVLTLVPSKMHGLTSLRQNVIITNNRTQIQNSSTTASKSGIEKTVECKEKSQTGAAPVTHVPVISRVKSLASTSVPTRVISKVVMSTVPKRVPLVSTVGNCSKAPAFAAAVLASSSATQSTSSPPVLSFPTSDESKLSGSILEARLTAVSSQQQNEKSKLLSSGPSVTIASISGAYQGRIINSSVGPGSSITGNSTEVPRRESNLQTPEEVTTSTKLHPRPLAILNYEKGLTRLVPIKQRSVVLVDVGVQVVLPSLEPADEVKDDANISDAPAHAVAPGTHSIIQGTSPPLLTPGQFVTVNPKTGKMMIAIPKHLIKSPNGSKTLLINGKPVKVQMKKSLFHESSTVRKSTNAQRSPAAVATSTLKVETSNVVPSSDAKQLKHSKSDLTASNDLVPCDASFSAPIVTFVDSTAPSDNSTLVLPTVDPGPSSIEPEPLKAPSPVSVTKSSAILSCVAAPSLEKSSENHSKKQNTLRFASLSTETVTTSCVQSPLSLAALSEVPCDDTKPLILPLNSPIHSPCRNSSVHTIPNTTSHFIRVSNSLLKQSPKKIVESGEAPKEIANPSVENLVACPNQNKRKAQDSLKYGSAVEARIVPHNISKKPYLLNKNASSPLIVSSLAREETVTNKVKINNESAVLQDASVVPSSSAMRSLENVTNLVHDKQDLIERNEKKRDVPSTSRADLHNGNKRPDSTNKLWDTMPSIMSPCSAGPSGNSSQVDDLVKNAFIDFKNCLTPNKDGDMPIHVAVDKGDMAAVHKQCAVLAARGSSVNVLNRDFETPLQIALIHGRTSIVELLLSRGADALVVDQEENSTLHLAVQFADHEALRALLQSGQLSKADADSFNDEGLTALHLAAQLNKWKDISLLAKFGCEIDRVDKKAGRTALYHALERQNLKAQQALCENGADMRETTYFGSSPMFVKADIMPQFPTGHQAVRKIVGSGLSQLQGCHSQETKDSEGLTYY